MIYYATGSPNRDLKKDDISAALKTALKFFSDRKSAVSYTHLTLPTIYSV